MVMIAEILGDKATVLALGTAKDTIGYEIKEEVKKLASLLVWFIKKGFLSGDPLHVKTGRLRRSITYKSVVDHDSIYALVGTKVVYAKAHEFGVDKIKRVSVKAHLRMNVSAGIGAWRKKKKMSIPMTMVKSFMRNQHIKLPERSFLRAALREMHTEIFNGLNSAVARGVAKSKGRGLT